MPLPPRARTGALSLLAGVAAVPFALPATASASPSGVVISELRVGGPQGGNDEFVELLNASDAPVAVGGWRLQGCASGSGAASDRTALPAGTTLPAGGRYLLANTATNGYSGTVRPDATYGTGFSNSGQSGVRLVEGDGTVQDAIGFAGSPCAEGAGFDLARIAGTGGDSAHRGGAEESADSDDNAADLTVAAPNPQRSDGDPGWEPREPEVTPIHRIQGAGAASPMQGATVTIEGVVTGIDDLMGSNYTSVFPEDAGIWVQAQDSDADADPSTSEGVFVGYVRGPGNDRAALLGRRVRLTGSVREKFGQTQVNIAQNTQPEVLGDGVLPAPVAIDTAAAEAQTVDEAAGTRSYYESLEGMRVTLPAGIANSGGTTKFGELFLNPGTTRQRVFNTTTGPQVASLLALVDDAGAGDPGRDGIDLRPPSATHVAASLFARVQNATGPLGFSFSNYKLVTQLDGMPTVTPDPLVPEVYTLDPAEPDELRVSGFNVENLFPPGATLDLHTVSQEEYDEKLDALAAAIRDRLRAPDVVAVQEIGDSLHAVGVPAPVRPKSSREVLQDLADRIGGYEAFAVEAFDERGIDVGYLVKEGVTVHGDAQQVALDVPRPAPSCSSRPDQAFDRIPLALEVEKDGLRTTIVNNHFKSKSDDSEICREVEAETVREVAQRLAGDGREVIVTGDLNAFEFETPLRILAEGGLLTNLWDRAPEQERYSYHYNGRLQTLDHALVTDGLLERVRDFRYAHLDNDHPYDPLLGQGVSDHDPPVLTLRTDWQAPADPAAFSTDVASVDAGSQALGTSGSVQRVVVRNAAADGTPGGSSLGIDAVTVDGGHPSDFAVTHSSCRADAAIAPGETCVVAVRFNPSELGARAATLTFATSVGTRELGLAGTGVAAPAGRDGRDGAPGPAGPRGPRGERGARGPRGPRGAPGRGVQITIVVIGGRTFDRGSLGDLSLGLRNASAATARGARVRVTLPRGLAAAASARGGGRARRSALLRVPAIRGRATKRVGLRVRTSGTARRGAHRARVSVRIGGRTVTRTIALRVR